jgi:hypothetical protein
LLKILVQSIQSQTPIKKEDYTSFYHTYSKSQPKLAVKRISTHGQLWAILKTYKNSEGISGTSVQLDQ